VSVDSAFWSVCNVQYVRMGVDAERGVREMLYVRDMVAFWADCEDWVISCSLLFGTSPTY